MSDERKGYDWSTCDIPEGWELRVTYGRRDTLSGDAHVTLYELGPMMRRVRRIMTRDEMRLAKFPIAQTVVDLMYAEVRKEYPDPASSETVDLSRRYAMVRVPGAPDHLLDVTAWGTATRITVCGKLVIAGWTTSFAVSTLDRIPRAATCEDCLHLAEQYARAPRPPVAP